MRLLSPLLSKRPLGTEQTRHLRWSEVVVRGGVEPPTFRFSGIGMTVYHGAEKSVLAAHRPSVDGHRPSCTRINETRTETGR